MNKYTIPALVFVALFAPQVSLAMTTQEQITLLQNEVATLQAQLAQIQSVATSTATSSIGVPLPAYCTSPSRSYTDWMNYEACTSFGG